MKKIKFGKIHIDYVTMEEAIEKVFSMATSNEGGYIVTPNVDHVVLAERNLSLRESYASAALSIADGMPLIWASFIFGHPLPGKISGSDIILPILERSAKSGKKVYFLGAGPGVGLKAAENVKKLFPKIKIVGIDSPPIGFEKNKMQENKTKEKMLAAKPDIVFFALGCPKQEVLMHRWHTEGVPQVMLGVGASLDFLAGRVKRAPKSVSDMGLEWLYRMMKDPLRLSKRYLVRDMIIIRIILKMALKDRKKIVFEVEN